MYWLSFISPCYNLGSSILDQLKQSYCRLRQTYEQLELPCFNMKQSIPGFSRDCVQDFLFNRVNVTCQNSGQTIRDLAVVQIHTEGLPSSAPLTSISLRHIDTGTWSQCPY